MSEPQFALAILTLVRAAGAIALFDLFRQLRKPSIAPVSAGMALYALAPLLTLLFGGSEHDPRTLVIQTVATCLIVTGVVAHFTHVSLAAALVAANVTAAAAALVSLTVSASPYISDLVFLTAITLMACALYWQRGPFRRAAGNSYFWGIVICLIAAGMYAVRLIPTTSPVQFFADQILNITVSVSLGLYVLNLEFNMAFADLNRSEARYRTLFDTSGDAILVSDFSGSIIDANTVATELLGYSNDELCAMKLADIDDDVSASMIGERMELIHRDGRAVFESTQRRKDGVVVPVEVNAVRIDWEGSQAILGNIRDLTERRRNEELILQMAYYDTLTGLANRTLFSDRLALAVAHAHRTGEGLALLFIDLDNFKTINDTLGHPMGDRLLASVAERLRRLVRDGDTVARLGGDEYTLLLPETGTESAAAAVAWKVLEALQAPFSIASEHDVHMTASIGIALVSTGDETPETLLRNADIAMFRAKDRGRNTYQFYDPEMNATALERFDLKNELRHALRRGELEVHYQPLVRMADRRIVGAEALLRWHCAGRGEIAPETFIPLAEESGLIVQVGGWVLGQACREMSAWHKAGFPEVRVAVNLSARQLFEEDLFVQITDVLTETGVRPSSLELEITESIAMQHAGTVLRAFERLAGMGIRIAIDDFGTGYSSLDRLKRLPIHTLKLAQPFVDDLGEEDDSAAIATTIIVLGQSLRLNVIAEGVESEEQFTFLNSLGCDEMQGYLFSPPLPAEEFLALLAAQA